MTRLGRFVFSIFLAAGAACGGGHGGKNADSAVASGGTSIASTGGAIGFGGIAATGGTVTSSGGASASGGSVGGGGSSVAGNGGADGGNSAGCTKCDGGAWLDANADVAQLGLCPSFVPCGGDVVGSWRMRSTCDGSSSDPCSGAAISREDISDYDLVYTFNTDGTMSLSVSGELRGTRRYPLQCLDPSAGAAKACESIQRDFEQSSQGALDAGVSLVSASSMSCMTNADGACVCSYRTVYRSYGGTGRFATAASVLKLSNLTLSLPLDAGTVPAVSAEQYGYCVSGNTLTLGLPGGGSAFVITLTR